MPLAVNEFKALKFFDEIYFNTLFVTKFKTKNLFHAEIMSNQKLRKCNGKKMMSLERCIFRPANTRRIPQRQLSGIGEAYSRLI